MGRAKERTRSLPSNRDRGQDGWMSPPYNAESAGAGLWSCWCRKHRNASENTQMCLWSERMGGKKRDHVMQDAENEIFVKSKQTPSASKLWNISKLDKWNFISLRYMYVYIAVNLNFTALKKLLFQLLSNLSGCWGSKTNGIIFRVYGTKTQEQLCPGDFQNCDFLKYAWVVFQNPRK